MLDGRLRASTSHAWKHVQYKHSNDYAKLWAEEKKEKAALKGKKAVVGDSKSENVSDFCD